MRAFEPSDGGSHVGEEKVLSLEVGFLILGGCMHGKSQYGGGIGWESVSRLMEGCCKESKKEESDKYV